MEEMQAKQCENINYIYISFVNKYVFNEYKYNNVDVILLPGVTETKSK